MIANILQKNENAPALTGVSEAIDRKADAILIDENKHAI